MVAVEGSAPGIAQAEGKDLGCAACCGEGIGGRDGVGGGGDVDAQDLAEVCVRVLGVAPGVAATSAIAGADIKEAIGAEAEPAAVMVGRLVVPHGQEGGEGGGGGGKPLGHGDRALRVGVIDEEALVGGKGGMEGQTEEALFAVGADRGREIEEGRVLQVAISDHPDAAGLFDDEEAGVAGGRGQEDRLVEAGGDGLGGDGHAVLGGERRLGEGRGGEEGCEAQEGAEHGIIP